jgi:phosphatidate cytidylyltransferase
VTEQHATPVADTDAGPTEPPPKKASRAGRDLPAAIAVGVVLGGMAIGVLFFAPIGWLPVLSIFIPIATHEVVRRLREAGYALPVIPLLIGCLAMIWLTWPFGPVGLLGAYGGTIVVCMVWRLVGQGLNEQPVNYLRDMSATVLLATWVPLFASFSALLIFQDHGGFRTFTVIVTVVFADIGGYVAGVLFGKHLMAPAISPKKSWEGLGGSLLFGITAAVLSVTFLLDKPAWVGVPLGLMLVITGVLGDLVESQVKRDLGIKDMGTLLPGHGGIMDRIDAMLPSAVAGWIVLTLLA